MPAPTRPMLSGEHGGKMGQPVRRDFWDWVNVLGDGMKAVLAGAFALAAVIGAIASGTISFGSNDDDAQRP